MDATNRLLLVVRGGEYLYYVNGQFVGRYLETGSTLPLEHYGDPGIFLSDDSTTGVFNDFAIYPAPPPYQPLLHGL